MKKITLKGGSFKENFEFSDNILKGLLHTKNFYMEVAIQFISNDKTVRISTLHDSKECNCQSLLTQAKKREQIVSMMPAFKKKSFDLMGDDITEFLQETSLRKKTMFLQ